MEYDIEKETREYLEHIREYEEAKEKIEQEYHSQKSWYEVVIRDKLQLQNIDTVTLSEEQITIQPFSDHVDNKMINLLAQLPDNFVVTIYRNQIVMDIHDEDKRKESDNEPFRIQKVTDEAITFTNGKKITTHHEQDCCEHVYADFTAIDLISRDYTFTEPLVFDEVMDYGFRFGNVGKMVSIPCYNSQNGCYNSSLDVLYDGEKVITDCELEDHIA